MTPEHLTEVARIYAQACDHTSRNPTMHVAKELGVPRSMAERWVARAHMLGFLKKIRSKIADVGSASEQWHSVCLCLAQGSPFIRFSAARSSACTVWISCPPGIDLEDLTDLPAHDRSMRNHVQRHGVARIIVGHLGLRLSPLEDDLLKRFSTRHTGADFWRAVHAGGLDADDPELPQRRAQDTEPRKG